MDDRSRLISGITKFQAIVRGSITRRRLTETRLDFQNIYKELQGVSESQKELPFIWNTKRLCFPRFCSVNHKKLSRTRANDAQSKPVKDSKLQDHKQTKDDCGAICISNSSDSEDTQKDKLDLLSMEKEGRDSLIDNRGLHQKEEDNLGYTASSIELLTTNSTDADKEPTFTGSVSLGCEKDQNNDKLRISSMCCTKEKDESDSGKQLRQESDHIVAEDTLLLKCDKFLMDSKDGQIDRPYAAEILQELSLELIWVQQAIQSRKEYLHLKQAQS